MRFQRLSRRAVAALIMGPLSLATVLALPSVTPAAPQAPAVDLIGTVSQASEKDTVTAAANASGQTHTSVCHAGAKWMRLRFTQLSLYGDDFIKLNGSDGGKHSELTSANWTGRTFHTRAFKGNCVDITPRMTDPRSSYEVSAYQAGTQDLDLATVTVAAVGDICGSSCDRTADLVTAMNPNAAVLPGDLAYDNGSLSDYNTKYDPIWGRFKSISYPTPGNHEYNTSNASGYFDYWNGVGNNTGRAGERGKGYYSFDVGDWHFVALNSNITRSAGSAQEQWLRTDLAANTKPCTAAFWHHPLFNKGNHGDDSSVRPIYQALYDAKADLVLVGHDHNYQRFNMARPDGTVDTVNGVREILYGTGGRGFYSLNGSTVGPLQASNANTFGVGKLTLTASTYRADFVPVSGSTYTDTVSGTCKKAATNADFTVSVNPSSISVAPGGSGTATATVTSVGGFTGTVNWQSISGLPAGVTANFNPASVTPSANGTASSTLTLAVGSNVAGGTYPLTITGVSGSLSHTANMSLVVQAATGDFTLGASPGSGTVIPGGSAATTVSTTLTSGVAQTVALSASGLPSGATASFNPSSITSNNGSSTLTIATSTSTPPGQYAVTITATGTSVTRTVPFTLTVNGTGGGCTVTNPTDVAITDNATVESSITISGCSGNAGTGSTVEVHIVHTYIGDLKVDLVAPDGTLYNLHNKTGGSTDNINQTYTVNLGSEVANGTWKLRVNDSGNDDVGKIDTWTLNVGGILPPACAGTNANDLSIPDNGAAVESSIVIAGCTGNAPSTSKAEVHIVHPYRGDLVVTLVAPDGSTYVLLNKSGGSADNVDQTFTVNLSAEARNGTWKLRVQDTASQDTGYINSWTLTL